MPPKIASAIASLGRYLWIAVALGGEVLPIRIWACACDPACRRGITLRPGGRRRGRHLERARRAGRWRAARSGEPGDDALGARLVDIAVARPITRFAGDDLAAPAPRSRRRARSGPASTASVPSEVRPCRRSRGSTASRTTGSPGRCRRRGSRRAPAGSRAAGLGVLVGDRTRGAARMSAAKLPDLHRVEVARQREGLRSTPHRATRRRRARRPGHRARLVERGAIARTGAAARASRDAWRCKPSSSTPRGSVDAPPRIAMSNHTSGVSGDGSMMTVGLFAITGSSSAVAVDIDVLVALIVLIVLVVQLGRLEATRRSRSSGARAAGSRARSARRPRR